MYERLEQCPVCDNSEFNNFIICKDYTVTQESFVIVECKKCHFKFTNPRPSESNIGKYYEHVDYISHSDSNKGIVNNIYQQVRKITLRNKLDLINRLSPNKGLLLDVGCGTGDFLGICKENGWGIEGVEPSSQARGFAEKKIKKKVQANLLDLTAYKGLTFQIITLWHVLEHMHRLTDTIAKLKKLLATDGSLIIAVPNCESHDANFFKENWAAYDVPRHLYHFSEKTVRALFKNYKLKVEEIVPMKWDAFYVSLLSTKYKDGKIDYINALKEGYISNKWAKNNENNYSSLIYIIKK